MSPRFVERPHFGKEGPCVARLVGQVEHLFGDRGGRPSPPVEELAALFAGTPVQARVAEDILPALWEK